MAAAPSLPQPAATSEYAPPLFTFIVEPIKPGTRAPVAGVPPTSTASGLLGAIRGAPQYYEIKWTENAANAQTYRIERRYSHFDALRQWLRVDFPFLVLPPIPDKAWPQEKSFWTTDEELSKSRARSFAMFLRLLVVVPNVTESDSFKHFLKDSEDALANHFAHRGTPTPRFTPKGGSWFNVAAIMGNQSDVDATAYVHITRDGRGVTADHAKLARTYLGQVVTALKSIREAVLRSSASYGAVANGYGALQAALGSLPPTQSVRLVQHTNGELAKAYVHVSTGERDDVSTAVSFCIGLTHDAADVLGTLLAVQDEIEVARNRLRGAEHDRTYVATNRADKRALEAADVAVTEARAKLEELKRINAAGEVIVCEQMKVFDVNLTEFLRSIVKKFCNKRNGCARSIQGAIDELHRAVLH